MLGTILPGVVGWEAVTRLDVVEVDDFDSETLRHGVLHDISTPARNSNEYLIHRVSPAIPM